MFRHLAVVMPAYNEEFSLSSFVPELLRDLDSCADRVTLVVVDDASTDSTAATLARLALLHPELRVERNERNRGHGPTAIRAYRSGLACGAEVVVHIDGDGQFLGPDVARVVEELHSHEAVHGVRTHRREPWFRRVLTLSLALLVLVTTRHRGRDVNTPLRAYRAEVLHRLLNAVPSAALIPNVHLTVAERRTRVDVGWVAVRSIERRGHASTGTMWGTPARPPLLPPLKMRRFVREATRELLATLGIGRLSRGAGEE